MNGYCGKLLKVDLTGGRLEDVPLSPGAARAYIGGSGLAAHLFFEAVAPAYEAGARRAPGLSHPNPFEPDNPLLVMTGPLTGTRVPTASRWTVSARSPLTGIWGEANVGGFFGAELKFAGYDGIVVTGAAEDPVYLLVDRGKAGLEPAGDLWGKDTYEVDDLLTARHAAGGSAAGGLRRPQVMTIGPAGENLVRYAAILHAKHHAAGRTGLGAVMGAKKLKAVVVRGQRDSFPVADPARLKELAAAMVARTRESMVTKSLGEAGTIMAVDLGVLIGDVPIRNWSRGAWDELDKVGVGGYAKYLTGTGTCFSCPVGCKRKVTVEAFGRKLEGAAGAEYETLACLGPNLLISDLAAIFVAAEISNRLGLDTVSTGGTLAYAYEVAETGFMDWFRDSARLKGAWGKTEVLLQLLEDIAYRRGIGNDLAEGSAALARKIGNPKARAYLATVKGLEPPAHDPRAAHGVGIAYATSTRGACHMASLMFPLEHGGFSAPEAGVDTEELQQSSVGKGRVNKAAQDLGAVFGQAAVFCQLGGGIFNAEDLRAALNAVTGFGLSLEDVLECGARIWHLKRGLGNLYGIRRIHDRLPPRLTEVFLEGGAAGSTPDMESMLAEWSEARGLDDNGFGRREVLEELGLGRMADLLAGLAAARRAGD